MKTKFTTLLLALTMVGSTVLLNSCKKDDDTGSSSGGGGGTSPQENSIAATIGTHVLDPAGLPIVAFDASNGSLSITSNDKDQSTTLALYISVDGANEQQIGGTAFASVQVGGKLYDADGGKVTLTTNDKTNRIVAGKFVFSAKDSQQFNIDVSDGSFYIKY